MKPKLKPEFAALVSDMEALIVAANGSEYPETASDLQYGLAQLIRKYEITLRPRKLEWKEILLIAKDRK